MNDFKILYLNRAYDYKYHTSEELKKTFTYEAHQPVYWPEINIPIKCNIHMK